MPARFTFALEPLLKARRRVEQGHQRAVAEIELQRMRIEENLRRQQHAISEGKQSLQSSLVGSIQTSSLRMHAASTMQLMRKAQQMALELAGVHRRMDTARKQLIEAARRRRAVEILREQRFEQWKASIEKAETAALDELAVISASRRKLDSFGSMPLETSP